MEVIRRRVVTLLVCSVFHSIHAQSFNAGLQQGIKQWKSRRDNHIGSGVDDHDLRFVAGLENYTHFQSVLTPILVPRVPDTPAHAEVMEFIASSMHNLGWTVERDQFRDNTPLKRGVSFTNVVATLDPDAPRRLVLACHYDSLLTNSGRFVGATDSAVPCAQLINLAHVMKKQLGQHKADINEVTLQFMFFDGEEAFVKWSRTDSTYGARHLASTLQQATYSATGARGVTHLNRIDLFVLLDLLGVANHKFYSYFPASEPWYQRVVSFERRLKKMDLNRGQSNMFQQSSWYNPGIEDDHIPFLEKGVPILHVIPYPFPRGWHKDSDNEASLHQPTIMNLNTLMRALVADYLHLNLSS